MRWAAVLVWLGLASAAWSDPCRDMAFEGAAYTVCEAGPEDDLRLFLNGKNGLLGTFKAIDDTLAVQGMRLAFAMNAGMYHADRAPVGLYVEDGKQASPLVTRDGPGNFGLLPNGVFCVGAAYRIVESRQYARENPDCRHATQSGPMLVIDGHLHPRFLRQGSSVNIRNGVGVSDDGLRAVFAISNDPVNFHSFARFFRDALGLPQALYFDGSVSRLYAPGLDRHDSGLPLGPIVGVVVARG